MSYSLVQGVMGPTQRETWAITTLPFSQGTDSSPPWWTGSSPTSEAVQSGGEPQEILREVCFQLSSRVLQAVCLCVTGGWYPPYATNGLAVEIVHAVAFREDQRQVHWAVATGAGSVLWLATAFSLLREAFTFTGRVMLTGKR